MLSSFYLLTVRADHPFYKSIAPSVAATSTIPATPLDKNSQFILKLPRHKFSPVQKPITQNFDSNQRLLLKSLWGVLEADRFFTYEAKRAITIELRNAFSCAKSFILYVTPPVVTQTLYSADSGVNFDEYLVTHDQAQKINTTLQTQFDNYREVQKRLLAAFELIESQARIFQPLESLLQKEHTSVSTLKEFFLHSFGPKECDDFEFHRWAEHYRKKPDFLQTFTSVDLASPQFEKTTNMLGVIPQLSSMDVSYVLALLNPRTCSLELVGAEIDNQKKISTFSFDECIGAFNHAKTALNILQLRRNSYDNYALNSEKSYTSGIIEYRKGILKKIILPQNPELTEVLNAQLEKNSLSSAVKATSTDTKRMKI